MRRGVLLLALVAGACDTTSPPAGGEDAAALADASSPGTADAGPDAGGDAGPVGNGDPTAAEAAAAMGKGFNLGQMFEATQHPRTLDEARAKIDAYYDKGFRNVRIPITWTEVVGGDRLVTDPTVGAVDRENPRLAVIESVVDYALSKPGMWVVINAHHEHALKTNARVAVLGRLWMDLVDLFHDRSHHLLFEPLNEPHKDDGSPMAPADLRAMVKAAYAQIRAVDPTRIVLLGGNQWYHFDEIPAVWTSLDGVGGGTDPYLMAEFHHYDPWSFCGNAQGDYADAWTAADMTHPMDVMKQWAATVGHGMPVYIGEWGVGWGSRYTQLTCNNVRLWYQQLDHDAAAPRGLPTSVWDDGGWFGVYDHASHGFGNNLADCIGGTCDWTGADRFAGCN